MSATQTTSAKVHGMTLAIAGPLLWGFSGIAAQFLFTTYQLSSQWLVCLRMFGAGLLLLLFGYATLGRRLFAPWRHWQSVVALLAFSLLCMMPAQLAYFMAIRASNAATTTVLQFVAPALVMIYMALRHRQWPRVLDLIAIGLALTGTVLLATGGHLNQLAIAPLGLFWGLTNAVLNAAYTIAPRSLLKQFGAVTVVGWAMLLGSFGMLPFVVNLPFTGHALDLSGWLAVGFVIIFGTLFAYLFVLQSLLYIKPTLTSLLSAFEPLTSTILTVLIFHAAFGVPAWIGMVCILATTFLQVLGTPKSFHHAH